MGILCWSPLSGGMLTGKYFDKKNPPHGTRLKTRKEVVKERYKQWNEKSYNVVKKVISISENYNMFPSVVSLAWLLKNKNISSVIIGATIKEQILENHLASDWELADDDFIELDALSSIPNGYPNDVFNNTTKGWFNEIS